MIIYSVQVQAVVTIDICANSEDEAKTLIRNKLHYSCKTTEFNHGVQTFVSVDIDKEKQMFVTKVWEI